MYFLFYSIVRYLLAMCTAFIVSAKIDGMGASRHPAFMAIVRLLITSVSPIYLVDELQFLFLLFLPLRPTHQRVGWRNLVCVECF